MNDWITALKSGVRKAGEVILAMRTQGVDVSEKANKDLLTQADLQADQILRSHLIGLFPDHGWLSEESVDDPGRLQCRYVWVVDPIDGTREYVEGVPQYAVSVALVEEGIPLLASVYNPASEEFFFAKRDGGAFLNDKRIYCKSNMDDKLTLLASRSEFKRGEWQRFNGEDIQTIGSIAYKLALIAAGRADATFSLGPKNEWDIAAGVLLVKEAGGVVTDQSQQAFIFNQPATLVNGIIASSASALARVMAAVK